MITKTSTEPAVAEQLLPVIVALQHALGDGLIALVLFGSRARSDARPDSDWDLLLIAKGLPDSPVQRAQFVQSLLPQEWRYQINLLSHTPEEWFRRVTPLALDISLDGILLYDNAQPLFLDRLSALRRQLAQLGLERRLINGEWLWLWRDQPQRRWELEWK
jgi:predicted nucleotidyltransferase